MYRQYAVGVGSVVARVDPLLSVSVRGVPCPVDLVLEGMQPAIVSIALEGGGVQPTRPKAATSGFGRAPERRRSICGEGAAASRTQVLGAI